MTEPAGGLGAPALLTHVFVPASGPDAEPAWQGLRTLWCRIVDRLGYDRPVPALGLPTGLPDGIPAPVAGSGGVAAIERTGDGVRQALVWAAHDVLLLTLMMAPRTDEPCGRVWAGLERCREELGGVPEALGEARLFLSVHDAGAQTSALVRGHFPGPSAIGCWRPGRTSSVPLATTTDLGALLVWEPGPVLADGRPLRRLALTVAAAHESRADGITWTTFRDGRPAPLTRHLLHAAKVRHHLRHFDDGRTERHLRDSTDTALDALVRGASPRGELVDRLRRLDESAAHRRARLRRMCKANGEITANLRAALRWMPDGAGPLADDRRLADWLTERLRQEISTLDAALSPVREILAAAEPGRLERTPAATADRGCRKAVVLTSSGDVYRALRDALHEPFELREVRGTLYETGVLTTHMGTWQVALVHMEPGMASAGLAADRAGSAFAPEAVVFVGLGGGLGEARPGDVVVADCVLDYQTVKETAQGPLPGGRAHRVTHRMLQYARHLARGDRWDGRSPDQGAPRALVGLVATGPTTVGDDRSQTAALLARDASEALLVDTEGHGFLHGAYLNSRLDVLTLHGVTHRVGETAEDPRASLHAAAFAFDLLALIPRTPPPDDARAHLSA
ncbi:CATRA conflict system CASPASE/TPR repeat-associated protein [Streptomyces sp. CB02400]|uniref:CATRA conflict system CASPASE/TPR repeat-associated protein n=1 Tax=Streptomyces sp. CB02400 TaxID=1703944 RepID=UPI00093DB1B5|nr:CATRA conflict system CASPASE/TPR repeat-associated protein [Streptomyces sp. CB02400]